MLLIGDVALPTTSAGCSPPVGSGSTLTIVLLNNDGGGIFHFLPVSGESDAFEEHVATPHGLDFAARGVALRASPTSAPRDAARELDGRALRPAGGTTIIEVRTDRAENLALHRRAASGRCGRVAAAHRPAPAASPAA